MSAESTKQESKCLDDYRQMERSDFNHYLLEKR